MTNGYDQVDDDQKHMPTLKHEIKHIDYPRFNFS
jgi:hypothetical protein